jgi:hypothetical protein
MSVKVALDEGNVLQKDMAVETCWQSFSWHKDLEQKADLDQNNLEPEFEENQDSYMAGDMMMHN